MKEAVSFESLSHSAMQLSARAIIDSADLSFLIWPDGQIAEATLGPRAALEIDVSRLKNRHVTEIVHPDDAVEMTNLIERARNGHRPRPARVRHSALIQEGTIARYTAHLAGDGMNILLLCAALPADLSRSARLAKAEIAKHIYGERDRG
ncbi:MAG: hypothetical protein AAF666_11040 [Pseudomonadota bacterium]